MGPHRQEGHLAYVPAQFCLAVQGSSGRIIFFEGTKHKRARCPSAPWASRRRRLAATPCYSGSCSPSPTARAALATCLLFKKFPYRQRNNGKLLIGDKGLGFRGILFLWTKSPVKLCGRGAGGSTLAGGQAWRRSFIILTINLQTVDFGIGPGWARQRPCGPKGRPRARSARSRARSARLPGWR